MRRSTLVVRKLYQDQVVVHLEQWNEGLPDLVGLNLWDRACESRVGADLVDCSREPSTHGSNERDPWDSKLICPLR